MDVNLIEPIPIETTRGRTAARRCALWTAIAVGAFTGSAIAFISGLLASAATMFAIVRASPGSARWIVAILLIAFALAYLGSHAIDRLDETRQEILPRK